MARKSNGLIDSAVSQMGKSMFGISNAAGKLQSCKHSGNKAGVYSARGQMGGFTKAYNGAKRKKGW